MAGQTAVFDTLSVHCGITADVDAMVMSGLFVTMTAVSDCNCFRSTVDGLRSLSESVSDT